MLDAFKTTPQPMNTAWQDQLTPAQLLLDTLTATSLARETAAPIRSQIAPRLRPQERDNALQLADALHDGRCCTDEIASGLAQLLSDIDAAIAAGTSLVERPADGRLVAGRDVPILERRLSTEAEELRQLAVPLRELLRLIRSARDSAAAMREAVRLLQE